MTSSDPGPDHKPQLGPNLRPNLWKVAVDAPLPSALTYRLPPELKIENEALRGRTVEVPLGRRRALGVLVAPTAEAGPYEIRDILRLDDSRPLLHEPYMKWIDWLANYYLYPLGQIFESAFPPLEKFTNRKSRKTAVAAERPPSLPPNLSAEQKSTIEAISNASGFGAHLVFGVTGSGKTEIYMQLLKSVVERGQQAIVLVPEISLTPQLIDRFSARFGPAVAVLHSHLTPREKTNQWWAMVDGEKQILIGARSALFCPLKNLGMIVVDEEHEASFKQDEKLRYHARDAAVMLAKYSDCPVVLGSATPSLESWNNAQNGRYVLHELKHRVENRALPEIRVVDLRLTREDRRRTQRVDLPFWLSPELETELRITFERREQSALFLNRRGVAQSVLCPACGFAPTCPNCDVHLTLHGQSHLLCHYCDFHEQLASRCKECHEGEPRPLGLGTEMVEGDLQKLFPSARILRMDRDEIDSREDLERAIAQIERREIDMIVGTQMIAKGLDFEGLTLVGLVLADVAFNLPDFRAGERAFQLLTQVSGRSGRHLKDSAGRVIIQTYNPEHPAVVSTQSHNYRDFAEQELQSRAELNYPPNGRLALVRILGPDLRTAEKTADQIAALASKIRSSHPDFSGQDSGIRLLGPAPAPMAKLRNSFRYQILVKAPSAAVLVRFCRSLLLNSQSLPAKTKVQVDIDALQFL